MKPEARCNRDKISRRKFGNLIPYNGSENEARQKWRQSIRTLLKSRCLLKVVLCRIRPPAVAWIERLSGAAISYIYREIELNDGEKLAWKRSHDCMKPTISSNLNRIQCLSLKSLFASSIFCTFLTRRKSEASENTQIGRKELRREGKTCRPVINWTRKPVTSSSIQRVLKEVARKIQL